MKYFSLLVFELQKCCDDNNYNTASDTYYVIR